MTTAARINRNIARLRELSADIGYAQRRLLEIQTGVSFTTPEERRRSVLRVRQLEHLYRA